MLCNKICNKNTLVFKIQFKATKNLASTIPNTFSIIYILSLNCVRLGRFLAKQLRHDLGHVYLIAKHLVNIPHHLLQLSFLLKLFPRSSSGWLQGGVSDNSRPVTSVVAIPSCCPVARICELVSGIWKIMRMVSISVPNSLFLSLPLSCSFSNIYIILNL